ncbi:MAG: MoaD/ThiS family protein [Crocinitomicaceae bacterium]|nr:MoaD/ThiS family protein [Crocinitomicaceae bacterium]
MMTVKILYFGMIAEKVGVSEEAIQSNFSDKESIKEYLEERFEFLCSMQYQLAINQSLTDELDANSDQIEVALLPPFAGG